MPSVQAPAALLERRGHIGIVTLNRPTALNAVDAELSIAVGEALDEIDRDPDLRIAVITGAGRAFCAGADLKALAAGRSIHNENRPEWGFAGIVKHWTDKPTIAAVNGVAFGGGAEIALSTDLLVMDAEARIGLPEVKQGLLAGAGGLLRLHRQLPWRLALEAALSGSPIDAETALRFGLANRIAPAGTAVDVALELAGGIAVNAPLAVRATKRILHGSAAFSDWDEAAWAVNDKELAAIYLTEDAKEGPRAFAAKRAPQWTGT